LRVPIGRDVSIGTKWIGDRRGTMSHLELSAHMTVRPGCLEGFRKQAAECIRLTKEKDTRRLHYDWFLSADGAECEVREACADNHFMTVYGERSQPLLELLRAHAGGFKWFTFLKGLEPSPIDPSRMPGEAGAAAEPIGDTGHL